MHTDIAGDIMVTAKDESFGAGLEVEQSFVQGYETDKVNAEIESCICKKEPLIKVLRLLCLQSVSNNGFKPKIFEFYKRELLQTYGFEHLLTLDALERSGLFTEQTTKNNYSSVKKALKLVVDENPDLDEPEDISHVYSGYAPLSVRLVQELSKLGGFAKMQDVLPLLPGPHFEKKQELPAGYAQSLPYKIVLITPSH